MNLNIKCNIFFKKRCTCFKKSTSCKQFEIIIVEFDQIILRITDKITVTGS